jgi:hypothetical protein
MKQPRKRLASLTRGAKNNLCTQEHAPISLAESEATDVSEFHKWSFDFFLNLILHLNHRFTKPQR